MGGGLGVRVLGVNPRQFSQLQAPFKRFKGSLKICPRVRLASAARRLTPLFGLTPERR